MLHVGEALLARPLRLSRRQLAQLRHRRRGRILALLAFIPPLGLGYVVILSHVPPAS